MSTKTTFKRIALVAVAALGLSLVSVVPSGAAVQADSLNHFKVATCSLSGTIGATNVATTADNFTDCGNYDTDTTNVLINGTAVFGIGQSYLSSAIGDAATVTVKLVTNAYNGTGATVDGVAAYSIPTALPVVTAGTYGNHINSTGNITQTVSADGLVLTNTSTATGSITGAAKVSFTPTLRGTYVISLTPQTGSLGKAKTWTVNAYADQAALDAANGVDNAISATGSTSFLNAGETTTATADATVSAAMGISTSAAATIVVTPKNAAGTTIANVTFPLTATISGPGTLAIGTNLAAITALSSGTGRAITGTTGHYVVGVFADGTAGPATITISSGTTVLATEKVTFYGDVASYSATVAKNVIPMATTTTGVVAVVAKDKDGNVVPSQTVHIKASDATVVANYTGTSASASEAAAGTATIQVIGIASKFGKLTLTIGNADVATITTTAVVTLSSTTAKTVTLAFDKTEYTAGEKMTLKATAVDENALPVAPMDPISGTPTSNTSLFGFPTTWDSTTTDGSVSYTMYAPLVPGPITVTGTDSNAAAITASATVISDGVAQAAADAATDAYDAALAATDAANDATAAAEAATAAAEDAADAVAALATQVTEMVNALKKQITALTNLVIKIQKKVKA